VETGDQKIFSPGNGLWEMQSMTFHDSP